MRIGANAPDAPFPKLARILPQHFCGEIEFHQAGGRGTDVQKERQQDAGSTAYIQNPACAGLNGPLNKPRDPGHGLGPAR